MVRTILFLKKRERQQGVGALEEATEGQTAGQKTRV